MNPSLKLLIELQQLDTTSAGLEAEIRSLPEKIAGIESQLSDHIQQVEADRKLLAENQRLRRKRENDIAVLREKISRFRDQTFEVKTNEQYRALLHEIEYHEAQIGKIEDDVLTAMIEAEALEKKLREAERALEAERSRAQQEIAEARQKKQEDEEKLQAVQRQRAEIQSQLPAETYRVYERVARLRRGWAVAPVENGACGACYVRLRPQAYNEVRTNEQILTCESCYRILYCAPEAVAEGEAS
ncbi:MAG: hypothetical protein HY647_10640 [Acidobacteria bacterium]|nr:hypothetical protein [Acidobacteriota bacterium]